MSNLTLVFICLLLGLAFQRVRRFPSNAAEVLNVYVIYVALPALVLNEIPKLVLDRQALLPVISAWFIMLFSGVLIYLTAQWLKWSREVTGAMVLVVTLGNTGFVGIPLIEAHLGSSAIPYAILYDQFGTFLCLNTFGVMAAGFYSRKHEQAPPLWQAILTFPAFLALLAALLLRFVGYPEWLSAVLPRLASTLVPVVMVAVGLQWRLRMDREHIKPLLIACVYILVLEPLFAFGLVRLLGLDGISAQVVVLEAAMPAMISAGVLASSYNLAPRLASAVVGYTVVLSLGTVWVWRLLITQF